MSLEFSDFKLRKYEFNEKLKWYEEEFDLFFGSRRFGFSSDDVKLANMILDRLAGEIKKYRDEELLFNLVSTLNRIERKHPGLF